MSIIPDDYSTLQPEYEEVRVFSDSFGNPPLEVITALDAGVVNVTRRVEIYERDGETLWNPNQGDIDDSTPDPPRLLGGSNITVDYNSAERRKIDLLLDNSDNHLRPDPNNGFWYDKILKAFWGAKWHPSDIPVRVAVAGSNAENRRDLINRIAAWGLTDVYTVTSMQVEEAQSADIVFFAAYDITYKADDYDFLVSLYNIGKKIITVGNRGIESSPDFPFMGSTQQYLSGVVWGIEPVSNDNPAQGQFVTEQRAGTSAGYRVETLAPGAIPVARWVQSEYADMITAILDERENGGRWFDLRLPDLSSTESRKLLRAMINYFRDFYTIKVWEEQLGEFMIDNMNSAHFPNQVKVTGRDYTKKLLKSKLGEATTFASGTRLYDVVTAVAINGGIHPDKIRAEIADDVLGNDMAFERGTPRWNIISEACEAFNYEAFFNNRGILTIRKYIDPTTGPIAQEFKTGDSGNLVTYDKSINDSRIYNRIVVTANPSDGDDGLPYYGEARNEEAGSPTSIQRLGEWMRDPIENNWLKSDMECYQMAARILAVSGLESYDLNFESLYYPWLETGTIIDIDDPDRRDFEPTRFLLTSLSFPLDLGPMSGTGSRITYVGSAGAPEEIFDEDQEEQEVA